ncbi:ABC transporter ATP-binding protein [Nocardia vaccinii]|uniref:ABC transporter ATP-binding protein n=1 Tax=Nocardia vaccinii TaxID=1822 RepID=UPI00082CCDB0|nr:ABC transporter ATP-binding protein [Nocardia vaccinii]
MTRPAQTAEAVGPVVPVIEARAISAGYTPDRATITDIDLAVQPGEIVAILGPNGAGKTTTLLALAGELPLQSGSVLLHGSPTDAPLFRRARLGLGFVPEERSVFKNMTVAENLRVGGVDVATALEQFPELETRLNVRGGMLSGGEQQMLTLTRALGRNPKVLLIDELSLGLAPLIVERLLQAVRSAADQQSCGVVLVEQHVRQALEVADRACVLRQGRIVLSGSARELWSRMDEIETEYLAG